MADPQKAEFRFGFAGMASKLSPDLLRDGQYRYLLNVESVQEGSLGSKTGIKQVGVFSSSEPTCYHIAKLCAADEADRFSPSTNPRYAGVLTSGSARNIYRTTDYTNGTKTLVASGVDSSASRHWEMAAYSAGTTGGCWGYFACPNAMLKDNATALPTSLYSTLKTWGVPPSANVPTAAAVTGSRTITAIDGTAPCTITVDSAVAISDYDMITISGVSGLTGPYAIRIGVPDANGKIINPDTQFRLYDAAGQGVTYSGTYAGGGTIANMPVSGYLDGGTESSPNNTQPYDYRTVYYSSLTGQPGNPSQPMLTNSAVTHGAPISIHNGQVTVTIYGTGAPNVAYIGIFRRGGTLYDAWRLLGKVANPGAGLTATWTDNMADSDLVYNDILEVDNDPPVTSTLATPLQTTLSGSAGPGRATVTLPSSFITALNVGAGVGTLIHFGSGDATDDAIVESINAGANQVTVYLQLSHTTGDLVEVDAITGQPCNLVVNIGDAMVVGGDPNNPHMLYKSKNGLPESFPVGTDAAGAVTSVGVGTPANGIVDLAEYRGQVLSMNVSALYEVPLINGSFLTPAKVADKGLIAQSAWCATESEVWFLSWDGIYSWDGSTFSKRSESIDPIFHGRSVNGIPPLDMTATAIVKARMAYRRGILRVLYTDTSGNVREIACEPAYGDRWQQFDENASDSPAYSVTTMLTEPDTQSLVLACYNPTLGAMFGLADAIYLSGSSNFTSHWWTTNPGAAGTPGVAIPYDIKLPWFDLGAPNIKKVFEEIWLELDPELTQGVYSLDPTITVDVLLDYSETPAETISVTIPTGNSLTGRQLISLLTGLANTGAAPGPMTSYGREAKAISFRIHGSAFPIQVAFYRMIFQYQVTGLMTAGGATDWMDLGHPYDKKLYQMTVEFDTEGVDRTVILDTVNGVNGNTVNQAVASFTLSNPVPTGPGRAKKTFPIPSAIIAKLVRLRQVATVTGTAAAGTGVSATTFFRILSVSFGEFEKFPADICPHTEWDSGGYEYDKYAEQLDLECDTNGVAVTIYLQADGTAVNQAVTVTATETDRQRNITLPVGLKGKRWRLYCDTAQSAIVSGGGKFQRFDHRIAFQPADRGEVGHTFDWDDLGYPYDKLLINVAFEYDTTAGGPITLQMDTLSGIGGVTVTPNVQQFVLGSGRGKTNFPVIADTVAKMVRIYPTTTPNVGFKQWMKYKFQTVNYPPDTVRVTEWRDASAPVDKEPSWLWIDANTANTAASVQLQNEGGTALSVSHVGTLSNRKYNYAVPVDLHAKMWRLLAAEGSGGCFQLFDWGFARWSPFDLAGPVDPPEIIYATPWTDFGYAYDKLARFLVVTLNTGGIACNVALQTAESGTVFSTSVTTTYNNRRPPSISCPSDLSGKLWRLVFTPGIGGLAQLWNWNLDFVPDQPSTTLWDSYEQTLGTKFFKFVKQGWWQYQCLAPVSLTLLSDTGSINYTLPAHGARATERFLLPAQWGSGFNKSKVYRVQVSSTQPLRFYPGGSGLEYIIMGGDRHASYVQSTFAEMMQIDGQ